MIKIFVNGTFDVLHRGHIELLNYARGLGDQLMVAIDTDNRVKQLKGSNRPVHNQADRKLFLENLRAVDLVVLFSSDEELEQSIKRYQPDIMVKGSDYAGKPIIGKEFVPEIKFFERLNEYSTTNTIQDIIARG